MTHPVRNIRLQQIHTSLAWVPLFISAFIISGFHERKSYATHPSKLARERSGVLSMRPVNAATMTKSRVGAVNGDCGKDFQYVTGNERKVSDPERIPDIVRVKKRKVCDAKQENRERAEEEDEDVPPKRFALVGRHSVIWNGRDESGAQTASVFGDDVPRNAHGGWWNPLRWELFSGHHGEHDQWKHCQRLGRRYFELHRQIGLWATSGAGRSLHPQATWAM